jgi:hypothetical protein
MAYLMEKKTLSDEPVGNWESVEYYMPAFSHSYETDASRRSASSMINDSQRSSSFADTLRESVFSLNNNLLMSLLKVSERPSELNTLHDMHVNDFKNQISCFL